MNNTTLKHYLGEVVKYNNEADINSIFPVLVEKWNSIVGQDLTKDEKSKQFMSFVKDLEWSVYEVMYDYDIIQSLQGISQRTLSDCYPNDPNKRAVLDCFVRWIDAEMWNREFIIYFHDLLMDMAINFYFNGHED